MYPANGNVTSFSIFLKKILFGKKYLGIKNTYTMQVQIMKITRITKIKVKTMCQSIAVAF